MAASIFDYKDFQPSAEMLTRVLGESSPFWEAIREYLRAEYGELTEEWKFYGGKTGWLLKTLKKKRNLFFFIPFQGAFRLSFVFGDRAVAAAEESDLPGDVVNRLKNARKYAEGRGLQIDVKTDGDVRIVKQLVHLKLSN